MADAHCAVLRGSDGDAGRQVAAGAVAAHGNHAADAAQGLGVLTGPDGGGPAIVQGFGELGLRGKAVVHRDDDVAAGDAQVAGGRVGGFQVADHPAAAVVPGQDGEGAVALGGVDADRYVAGGAGDRTVFNFGDLRADAAGSHGGVGARLRWGYGMVGRQAQGSRGLDDL